MMIRRLAKEPFVHFLLLGCLIFGANLWFDRGGEEVQDDDDRIVIDQQDYDHLKRMWQIQWKREPAPGDIEALLDRYQKPIRLRFLPCHRIAGYNSEGDVFRTPASSPPRVAA